MHDKQGEKQVIYLGEQIREKILNAIHKLAGAVKVTLGPKGRNVILRKERDYYLTKDGVTVAKSLYTYDPVEQVVMDLMKDVALETNRVAGDGTTTAITLAEEILKSGLTHVAAGTDPGEIKRSLENSLEKVLEIIDKIAHKVEGEDDLTAVATISANNNKEIGKIVAKAILMSNENSVIDIKESPSRDTYVEQVKGYNFEMSGYLDKGFINNGQRVEKEEPKLLLVDDKVNSIDPFLHILQQCAERKDKVILVARHFTPDVVRVILYNNQNRNADITPITAPGIRKEKTNYIQDLAAFSGADLFTKNERFPKLGEVEQVIVNKYSTTFINSKADTAKYIEQVKHEYEDNDAMYDEEKLKKRLSNLTGNTAVIYVGGDSELEVKETIDRVEDALNATKAAQEDGVVPGGGSTLFKISQEHRYLDLILLKALRKPAETIIYNATSNSEERQRFLDALENSKHEFPGYEGQSHSIVDMKKTLVIDPAKVTKEALKNAVAIGSMLLTTEGLVLNEF